WREHSFSGVEERDERAGLLFRLVSGLGVQVGVERSFKMFSGTLLSDRLLLGFKRSSLGGDTQGRILDICKEIGMPGDFLDTFEELLPESNIVLFGFEKNHKGGIYNSYLEFGDRIVKAIRREPSAPEPVAIHEGFKWDAADSSNKTRAKYTCFPRLSLKDMSRRIARIVPGGVRARTFCLVGDVLELVSSRVGSEALLYFEATEEANPRRSFDVNLYRANLRLGELYPILLRMCLHYDIPPRSFDAVYEPVKNHKFGHLTGGTDREGRDFLTVYFGRKGSQGPRSPVGHDLLYGTGTST
ncbi:MAG: hypothetical protein JRJ29_15155, partial [Deltaproteobacteria bacterium]|nr:hypothetical protein [Deltaproteobacteria bacterium]